MEEKNSNFWMAGAAAILGIMAAFLPFLPFLAGIIAIALGLDILRKQQVPLPTKLLSLAGVVLGLIPLVRLAWGLIQDGIFNFF